MDSSSVSRVFNLCSTSKKPPELVYSDFDILEMFGLIFLHSILHILLRSDLFSPIPEGKASRPEPHPFRAKQKVEPWPALNYTQAGLADPFPKLLPFQKALQLKPIQVFADMY